LDEALEEMFPASDPIAIAVELETMEDKGMDTERIRSREPDGPHHHCCGKSAARRWRLKPVRHSLQPKMAHCTFKLGCRLAVVHHRNTAECREAIGPDSRR
jgi:hypothetical protein